MQAAYTLEDTAPFI